MKSPLAAAGLGDDDGVVAPDATLSFGARSSSGASVGERGEMKVTLLSGFLGAGKTTLMKNVLMQAREERLSLAVIVNDMADVNVGAELLALGDRDGKAGGEGLDGLLGTADDGSVGDQTDGGASSVAMQDGFICCTLRDDLLREVEAIAREGKHQHLIIESSGISDPTHVAEALASSEWGDGGDHDYSNGANDGPDDAGARYFSLDTLVTVVDSTSFLDEVRRADDLEERGLEAEEGDTRTIADLLVSQVEFANVILLNKEDLAQEGDMATLEGVVRRLNPAARVVRTVSSNVDLAEVLGTGDFDLEEASHAAGWMQALNEQPEQQQQQQQQQEAHDHSHDHHCHDSNKSLGHDEHDGHAENGRSGEREHHGHDHGQDHSHGEACGDACGDGNAVNDAAAVVIGGGAGIAKRRQEAFSIGSFTFRARRPFHPKRLMGFVMEHLPTVLRSKGFLWLATRHHTAGVWDQAGGSFATEFGGSWDEDVDDVQGELRFEEQRHDDVDVGENTRRNELVFIGLDMDEEMLTKELWGCLVTEEEMAKGTEEWERMEDPFPPWDAEVEVEDTEGEDGDVVVER